MEQDGRPIALALAGCAAWREGEPEWADIAAPDGPAPGGLPRGAAGRRRPSLPGALRAALGRGRRAAAGRPSARATSRGCACRRAARWTPSRSPRCPTAGCRRRSPSSGASRSSRRFDLTIHFRAPLPAPGELLLAEYRSTRLGRRRLGGGRRAVGAGRHAGRPVAPARDDAGTAAVSLELGYLGLGSNLGDRRAQLQAAVEDLWRARRAGDRVLLGLRDRAGRRGPRPAARSSTRACGSRPRSGRRRCSTRARRSSGRSAASRAGSATGRGRSTSTSCCSARRPTRPGGSRSRTASSRGAASSSRRCSSSTGASRSPTAPGWRTRWPRSTGRPSAAPGRRWRCAREPRDRAGGPLSLHAAAAYRLRVGSAG